MNPRRSKLALSLLFVAVGFWVQTARAATFTVTRTDDRNLACASNTDCSLREAINAANGAGGSNQVDFNGVSNIQLAGTLPSVTTTISIAGGSGVTVNGDAANSAFRVFLIPSGGNLSLGNITVTNAKDILGGGLFNQNGGTVSLTDCSFTFNLATATAGGAIFNDGMMTLNNVDVSFNSASSEGDGIRNGANGNLSLTDCTVSFNGSPGQPSGIGGGGIDNAGMLNVNRSTIYGNLTGGNGGGIFNLTGTAKLTNSTIAFNSAAGNNGGGIFNGNGGTATLVNCTVTDQNTAVLGGGIYGDTGTLNLQNTIVAGNSGTSAAPDVLGNYNAPAYDLIGIADGSAGFVDGVNGNIVGSMAMPVDPRLAPIANNGGPTQTYALMMGSPAANKGNNPLAVDPNNQPLTTDQRGTGFPRIVSFRVDIGSFESNIPTAASATVSGRVLTAGGYGIASAQVSITDINGVARTVLTNAFGYYSFTEMPVGGTYIIAVAHKRYRFSNSPQIVNVNGELNAVDFIATF